MDLGINGGAGAGAGGNGGGADGGGGGGSAADILGAGAGAGGDQASGAGAGDPNAGAAGDGGQGGAGGQAGPDPDWYRSLSAQPGEGETASNFDWVKAKGFKDLDGLTKALRSAEKAIHDSGRVKVPGEGATAEDIAAFHKAIGVPEAPDGYDFGAIKDGEGNAIPLDEGAIRVLAEAGLKLGAPKGVLEGLVGSFVAYQREAEATAEAELAKEAQAWVKEQGQQANGKLAQIDQLAHAIGLTREEMVTLRAAWGPKRALDVLAKLGAGMAEDVLVTGGRGRFGITAAEAQNELNKFVSDKALGDKARIPGTPEHARRQNLIQIIAAEEERKARAA